MSKALTFKKFTRRIVFMTTFFIALFFALYSYFVQTSFVKSTIQSDTKVMADIVFENLYIAMQRGSNKEELDSIIVSIESKMPDTQIHLYDKKNLEAVTSLRDLLQNKQSHVTEEDGLIHFYTPILFEQKCLKCHVNAQEGEIASVIHFASLLSNVKISLKDLMFMLIALFSISVAVLFLYWFFILNKYFAYPIEQLIRQMNRIATHEHLQKGIQINAKIAELQQIEVVFNQQNKKLLESYNRLETISNTDKLTGVANRKKFEELVSFYRNLALRHHEHFSLVLIDLNRFKSVNDMYGHHIGDMVLIEFVTIVNSFIRSTDTLCRIGGDEFILLLPHTTTNDTKRIMDKIDTHLDEHSYNFENRKLKISASFGVVEFGKDAKEISELLRIADERMYKDKQAKHRV